MPPDLADGAQLYLAALDDLARDRSCSVGLGGIIYGRIPYASLDRWAERHGITDRDGFARLKRIVCRLDDDEVRRLNEKANRKPPA